MCINIDATEEWRKCQEEALGTEEWKCQSTLGREERLTVFFDAIQLKHWCAEEWGRCQEEALGTEEWKCQSTQGGEERLTVAVIFDAVPKHGHALHHAHEVEPPSIVHGRC